MIPTPPGKFVEFLEFLLFSKAWKGPEISVGIGKFWKFDFQNFPFVQLQPTRTGLVGIWY